MGSILKRKSMTWVEVLRRTWKEADKDDVLGRSAQLSYYFFLALFPLLICMLALLGMFSAAGEHVREGLLRFVGEALPFSAYDLVRKTLDEVNSVHSTSKLSAGILFSLWSASAGMSAIMDTLNAEYGVVETRPFLRRNMVAIGLTVSTAVILLAAATIVLGGGTFAEAFSNGIVTVLLKSAQWLIAAGLVLFGFALIYFLAPDVKEQKWYWITPGAVVGVLLWLVASMALKIYLHFFNSYTATYGSLGAVIILLLWFYVAGAALLVGAELNSVLEEAAATAGEPEAKAKGEDVPGEKAFSARA